MRFEDPRASRVRLKKNERLLLNCPLQGFDAPSIESGELQNPLCAPTANARRRVKQRVLLTLAVQSRLS